MNGENKKDAEISDGNPSIIEDIGQSTTEQFKDTLFKDIFSDKQRFLELYNAISDKPYNDEANVEVYSNHALLAKYHDIAGSINNELVMMCERQSSINPNMPLRMLLYFADVLRTFIIGEEIYGGTKVEIPTPVFNVLYNGDTAYNKEALELSDSFKVKHQLFTMNMRVKVVNINPGYNTPALEKSPWLNGYAKLITKIKEYLKADYTRDKAIELAIDWCIENEVIKKYLQENYERVIKMLNYEITQEQWIRIHKRDERAEIAKEMLLDGESMLKIIKYSKLDKNTLSSILSELPQETQDKYRTDLN
jgi:hypothetical protein